MIFRKLLFVFLLVSFAFASGPGDHFTPGDGRHAPFRRPWMSMQSNKVELDLTYDLLVRGKTNKISFVTLVPQTIPDRQTISSINYSPKPSRIFSRNGNQYAEFVFFNPKRYVKIKINVKAELFEYTIMTAIEKGEKTTVNNVDLAEFLKQEVEAAGFVFDGSSDALRNPNDPHDIKVFDKAIRGHTDQFIYRFRKPAKR